MRSEMLAAIAILLVALGCDGKTSGPPPRGTSGAAELELVATSARLEGSLLRVNAQLINHADRPRELRTNFASVFDGVSMEVLDAKGRVVERAHYTHHQSPFTSEGRPIPVPPGRTAKVIGVPFEKDLPTSAYQVRLVGEKQFYGTPSDLRSSPVVIQRVKPTGPR